MKVSILDGLLVHRAEDPSPLRIHAPRWYRLDRHLAWLFVPKERRGSVSIRFLGASGMKVVDVRAVVVG